MERPGAMPQGQDYLLNPRNLICCAHNGLRGYKKSPGEPGQNTLHARAAKAAVKTRHYERLSSMAFCSIWSAVVTTLLLD